MENATLDDARMLLEFIYSGQTEVPNDRMQHFDNLMKDYKLYGWVEIDGMKRNVLKSILKPTPPNVTVQSSASRRFAAKENRQIELFKCLVCGAKTVHRRMLMDHYEREHPEKTLRPKRLFEN